MSDETAASVRLLADFFRSDDPIESQQILGRLISDQALPIIRNIVSYKINAEGTADHRQDAEDVSSDIVADLINRVRELKAEGRSEVIRDFRAYVAVASYHGCNDYFRRRFPQRHRMKNKLRYLLAKDPRFALWQDPGGEWYCGRKEWSKRILRSALPKIEPEPDGDAFGQDRTREAAAMLARTFDECGAPVRFDDLVDRLTEAWGISEQHISADSERIEVADPRGVPGENLDRRTWLRKLWTEIQELPVRQRLCLLLNLRDHQDGAAIALLPVTGIATIRQIAAVLEIAAEELAGLWQELPFDDARIASRLGVTRQQVINLRKSARERLARKLNAII